MIEVDGSYGSGGGQIVRTAAALACITGKAVRIFNIRAKRPRPGLMPQHLFGIRALAELCGGSLEGDRPGSTEVKFYPGNEFKKSVEVSIPTAGSVGLVLQTLFLPSSIRGSKIRIKGGATFGRFAPPIPYIQLVLLPLLGRFGFGAEVRVERHGFYPKGGAEVEVTVEKWSPEPADILERGSLNGIKVVSVASSSLQGVADRQVEGSRKLLEKLGRVSSECEYPESLCPGSGIVVVGDYENSVLGSDALGEPGKRAEIVGREAAEMFLRFHESGAALDRHAADQVIPFLALSGGRVSVAEITNHCLTNIWVTEKFLGAKFEIKGSKGKPGEIAAKNF